MSVNSKDQVESKEESSFGLAKNDNQNSTQCDIYSLFNIIENSFNNDLLLIDTRDATEFSNDHILESINVPFNTFKDVLSKDNTNKDVKSIFDQKFDKQFIIIEKVILITDIEIEKEKEKEKEKQDIINSRLKFMESIAKFMQVAYKQYCKILILKDPFVVFKNKYPFLCYINNNKNDNNNNNNNDEKKNENNSNSNDKKMKYNVAHKVTSYPNQILNDKLFLGNWNHSINETIINNLEITHILNVTPYKNQIDGVNGLVILQISIEDIETEDILSQMDKICTFIHSTLKENGNKLLVNCRAGRSRSSTAICSYLIKYHSMTVEEAISFCVERRPIVEPNQGFVKQLKEWQKICQKQKNNNNGNDNGNDKNGNDKQGPQK